VRIPDFLSHLRVDDHGRPVPYINRWGQQRSELVSIQHDPWVHMPGVFYDDARETVPDFKAQNMGRQREIVARGLCQVCARQVPWSRRFLVISTMSVEEITLHGRRVAVVMEPWLDERCADFALTKCPGLIRKRRSDDLQLVQVRQRDATLIVSTGYVDGPLEDESRRVQPAMWCKVALSNLRATERAA